MGGRRRGQASGMDFAGRVWRTKRRRVVSVGVAWIYACEGASVV